MTELKTYYVWDANIRRFHWVNLICVLGLIAVGVVILNSKALGVSSDGKILLKTIHVWIGYVFALNLLWRLVWAAMRDDRAGWRAILPWGQDYVSELRAYMAAIRAGNTRQYLGHNPLGRIAVSLLFLLLFIQAVSGLVLAGTDLFYPPLGSVIAGWIAGPGVEPSSLVPYAKEMYDAAAYEEMRSFRKPFITMHYYVFYLLLVLSLLHIVAVVMTELREGGNLISAMFTGSKILKDKPADMKESE